MKKLALLFALLFATPAAAGVPCSLPFNLQNATIADATQVMANYNALVACLGNAAAAGSNNDITSLNALASPISPAVGGSTLYIGNTSTGTNTQVVSSTIPSPFLLTTGRSVMFIVGTGNTGSTTLNVATFGDIPVARRTQFGLSSLVGGELVAGQPAIVMYNGSLWVLISGGPYLVGEVRTYAGVPAAAPLPPGWLFADGSCQSRAQFPDLFNIIQNFYDPTGAFCDSAHFALPDFRGRVQAGWDAMGTQGAANRITSAGSGCLGTLIGSAGCGAENRTASQLPAHNHALFLHDPGHVHNFDTGGHGNNQGSVGLVFNSGGTLIGVGGTAVGDTLSIHANTTGISPQSAQDVAGFPQGTANQTGDTGSGIGSNTGVMSVLPPLQIIPMIIKL